MADSAPLPHGVGSLRGSSQYRKDVLGGVLIEVPAEVAIATGQAGLIRGDVEMPVVDADSVDVHCYQHRKGRIRYRRSSVGEAPVV